VVVLVACFGIVTSDPTSNAYVCDTLKIFSASGYIPYIAEKLHFHHEFSFLMNGIVKSHKNVH